MKLVEVGQKSVSLTEALARSGARARTSEPPLGRAESFEPAGGAQRGAGQAEMQVGLIDCHRFSQECLVKALTGMSALLTLHPFSTAEALAAVGYDKLDLVIYYSHATTSWDAAAQRDVDTLQTAAPGCPPLIVMSDIEEAHQSAAVRHAMAAGARGFIPTRTTGMPITLAVIRFIEAGGTYAPLDFLLDTPQAPPVVATGKWQFTLRQKEVFALLQQGMANKNIAHALRMSESTVKVHVRNIMRLTGATNRTQAAYRIEGWEAAASPQPAPRPTVAARQ